MSEYLKSSMVCTKIYVLSCVTMTFCLLNVTSVPSSLYMSSVTALSKSDQVAVHKQCSYARLDVRMPGVCDVVQSG